MPILNKDIIDDQKDSLESERINRRIERIQAEALARIANRSDQVKKAISQRFSQKSASEKVASLNEDTFSDYKVEDVTTQEIHDVEVEGASGTVDKVTVKFKEKFDLYLTEDELKKDMKEAISKHSTNHAYALREEMGIDIGPKRITEAQIDALAKKISEKFKRYKASLPANFEEPGVNALNRHLAADFTRSFTEKELNAILNPDGGGDDKLDELKSKTALHSSVTDLSKIEGINDSDPIEKATGKKFSFKSAKEEIAKLKKDKFTVQNETADSWESQDFTSEPKINWSSLTPEKAERRKAGALQEINDAIKSIEKLINKYVKIEKALNAVVEACNKAKEDVAATAIKTLLKGTPPVLDSGKLDEKVDPGALAKDVIANLKLKEDGYATELADAKKKAEEHGAHHESLSGAEAVIAIFKAHIKKEEKCSDAKAEELAYNLFVKNSLDESVKTNLETTIKDDILKQALEKDENGIFGFLKRKGMEIGFGHERTYVANLAKKAGVKFSRLMAEPDFSDADYPKVVTMYYALRDSVKENQLTNSTFVREQLLKVGHLLSTKFATDTLSMLNKLDEGGDDHGDHGEKKEGHAEHGAKKKNAKETARLIHELKTNTKVMLGDDVPAPYDVEVRKCIDYAKENTAWLRRSLARGSKNLALSTIGVGEWADTWKNPASYPAWATKNTARYTWEHKGSIGSSATAGLIAGAFILPGIGAPIGAAVGALGGAVFANRIEQGGRAAWGFTKWFVSRPDGGAAAAPAHH